MALPKEALKWLEEVCKTRPEINESRESSERIRSLELAVAEQRRDWDALNQAYESAKRKNISFLAAGFAILGYLYGSNIKPHESIRERLFIPSEAYGVIIYGLAAGLFLFAISTLMLALRSNGWSTAYEDEQEDDLLDDYERYLKYIRKRYLKCSTNNRNSYNAKYSLLEMSFLPLVLGGILLLIFKVFVTS